jgi:threonine/homoserine/homoserine lactone efflux protein
MAIPFFLKGIIIGVSIAAPIGPIGILCIKRSLTRGYSAGFATGLGAALADLLYAIVAGFGLTAVSSFLISQQTLLYSIGSIVLIALGVKTLTSPAIAHPLTVKGKSFVSTMLETMILTLTNPFTIIAFIAAFATIGFTEETHNYRAALMLCTGVFLGSTLWFTLLSSAVSFFRSKCTPGAIRRINTISGIFLVVTGIFLMLSIFLSSRLLRIYK